jgi:hypothetical protein
MVLRGGLRKKWPPPHTHTQKKLTKQKQNKTKRVVLAAPNGFEGWFKKKQSKKKRWFWPPQMVLRGGLRKKWPTSHTHTHTHTKKKRLVIFYLLNRGLTSSTCKIIEFYKYSRRGWGGSLLKPRLLHVRSIGGLKLLRCADFCRNRP